MNILYFDTETNGLSTHHGARPFLFIWKYNDEEIKTSKNIEDIRPYLEDPTITKVGHNLKFDILMVHSVGCSVNGKLQDTMIMKHLIDENTPKSMDYCAKAYLNIEKQTKLVDDWFKEHKILKADRNYQDLPDEIIIPYAIRDVEVTYQLYNKFLPIIVDQGLEKVLLLEHRLIPALVDTELRGFKIDLKYFEKQNEESLPKIDRLEANIYKIAGKEFNMRSPKQLAEVLKEKGAYLSKTNKGNDKTDVEALKKINHPLAKAILDYRTEYKFARTYFKGILENQVNETIHCQINQCGTTTGRCSSSKPNLQNLHKEDTRVRKGFINKEDYINFYIDYEQMEYRVFADYARDEYIIKRIIQGDDFHQIVADELFIDRKMAKTLNFGLLYGMGTKALAKVLDTTFNEAENYKSRYFERFTNVFPFLDAVNKTIRSRGHIFNKFKRRRRLTTREAYKAVNSLIQGVCADIVKYTMVRIWQYLKPYKSNLILQVHDELVIEIHKDELFLVTHIKEIMEDWGGVFKVPLSVEVSYTKTNWSEKEDYK